MINLGHQTSSVFIRHFSEGDPEAFTVIFKRYFNALCFFADQLIRDSDTAKDIAEQSLEKLWLRRNHFCSTRNIQAFLYITTRNACINFIEQSNCIKKHNKKWASIQPGVDENALEHIIRKETAHIIQKGIAHLPLQCRKVISLAYIQGMKNMEISKELGISVHTVKNQKVRGVFLIKKYYQGASPARKIMQKDIKAPVQKAEAKKIPPLKWQDCQILT